MTPTIPEDKYLKDLLGKDSLRFANFAQRVKMKYWETLKPGQTHVAEYLIDELLLIVFEEVAQANQAGIIQGLSNNGHITHDPPLTSKEELEVARQAGIQEAVGALRINKKSTWADSVEFPSGEIHTAEWKEGWNAMIDELNKRIEAL